MKHFVVCIGREFGSGGAEIGKLLAKKLGVRCYDSTLIDMAVEKTGFVKECLVREDESMTVLRKSLLSIGSTGTPLIADELMQAQCEIIRHLAEQDSCVIVGRCADYVLKDMPNVVNIFVSADISQRLRRAIEVYELPKAKAEENIIKFDKRRSNYYNFHTGQKWGSVCNYHLAIRSDFGGIEHAVETICKYLE